MVGEGGGEEGWTLGRILFWGFRGWLDHGGSGCWFCNGEKGDVGG